MEQLVTAVITPVVELVMGVVKKHLGFCFYSTNSNSDMRVRIEHLNHTARDWKRRKETYDANNLVVPHEVPSWLEQVEKICEEVGNVPAGGIGCFNMKTRYKAGKQSFYILKDIDRLMKEKSDIEWSDEQRPLGRVRSTDASTSKSVATAKDDDGTQTGLKSRDLIFKEAIKSLDPNNKIQKTALCGMGGVGKTTMMEQLKKAVEGNKLFDWVMKVDIGKNPNPINLQRTIAEYFGKPLQETVKDTRAKSLFDRFVGISENGKKNILVILDDLWDEVDLKDIGLTNPLPEGFKLLLTSREENVCTRMGVEASSIFRIAVLEEPEAKKLFWEIVGRVSDGDIDRDICKIGEDIVKKCGGLPIAIKTIASTLRDNNEKDVWVDTLERLQNKELSFVETVFKTSYENLKDDDEKATFLLSGLFPDDYNIPIEDLMSYGWGLKFFKNLKTISTARRRVNTCVNNLVRSNMLIESDRKGCVKMHDLVRDFILSNFSNVKQASLVNSDDISEQLHLTEESYERILLKCTGMREFPADFNHPNLALLKLLDGNKLRTFPEDFYDRMEKLEVVAYEGIRQPLLPRYSTSLRTLCLRSCRLVGDISFVGDLVNLEVLSLAFSGISKLPSAIGNLKKLKLLDLTECVDLCIDDGVFHKLEKLRELYMIADEERPIRFTEDSCEGLKMLSSKLIALDVEFFGSIIQPKNISFEKLERFRISMGCQLENSDNDEYAYENTLKLFVTCKEVLECKINELFKKTEILDLSVNEMSSLEEISVHPSQHSFCNLRDFRVHKCADLTSIFTVNVASSLTKLESLAVLSCPVLESLVQEGENSEAKVIKFHKLKVLRLDDLPMFVSLCDTDQVMELPQLVELEVRKLPNVTSIFSESNEICATRRPLFSKKIVIPNLEYLRIWWMEKLKEIWWCENTTTITHVEDVHNISNLREITVWTCDSVVNIFPCNGMRMRLVSDLAGVRNGQKQQPLSLFHNLTTILLKQCKSIKYLFSPLMATHLSNLKDVTISECDGMEEVVSNRDDNEDEQMTAPTTTTLFPHLEQLYLHSLPSLKHVGGGGVAKSTNNDINDRLKNSQVPVVCWSLCQYSREIIVSNCPAMSHVIPSHVAGQILMVERLSIYDCIDMKEVFATTDINSSGGLSSNFEERSGGTDTALAIPRLTSITAHKLSNLKTMDIRRCNSLEHIFTVNVASSLTKLESLRVSKCPVLESLVQEGENSEAKAIKFHKLKFLELRKLPMFVSLCDTDQVMELPQLVELELFRLPNVTSIFSESNEICATRRPLFSKKIVIPNLEKLKIRWGLEKLKEIWSCENTTTITDVELHNFSNLKEIQVNRCPSLVNIFACNWMRLVSDLTVINGQKQQPLFLFHNLTTIYLEDCNSIKYLFSPLLATHLSNLKAIQIKYCNSMEEVVSNRDDNDDEQMTASTITTLFPHLEELNLYAMSSLKHVGGGGVAKSTNNDINDRLKNSQVPVVCWSLCQYSREIIVSNCPAMSHVIPSHVAGQILMVERLSIYDCIDMKEVFATTDINSSGGLSSNFEERSGGTDTALAIPRLTSITAHKLSNLKTMDIRRCNSLEHIFTVNVASSLTKLESLKVSKCPVLESLVQEGENSEAKVIKFHKLKSLELEELPMFVSLCDTDQVMELPQLVELEVTDLPNVTSIFAENNEICGTREALFSKKIVIPNLEKLKIWWMEKLKEIWWCENTTTITHVELHNFSNFRKIDVQRCDSVVNIFPCNWMRLVSDLAVINGQKQQGRCWNDFLILQNQQPLSLFHDLTTIILYGCYNIKYLFSPLLATHLPNLKNIYIDECNGMEEVVSNRDDNEDEHMTAPTTTTLFPHLDSLYLWNLPSLKHVGGGGVAKGTNNDINNRLKNSQVPVVCWSLCQYSREITVSNCPAMSHVIPSHVAGQILMVERLSIHDCTDMKEVFATTDINSSGGLSSNFEERSGGTDTALAIPRLTSITAHKLSNLKTMDIRNCDSLEHIFTFSTLESLTKLEEISITKCKAMKVIVREENGEKTVASKAVVFPHLKSIVLTHLPNLEGFFLGMSDFKWPSLNTLVIKGCPILENFNKGRVAAQQLKVIETGLGLIDVGEQDINSFIITKSQEGLHFAEEEESDYEY